MSDQAKQQVTRYIVGTAVDLPPGTRRIFSAGGRSIGVFNVGGRFFAVRNRCPHQGGPLCLGTTGPLARPRFVVGAAPEIETEREGEIIKCPWHGWEFDLATGEAVFDEGVRIAAYKAYLTEHGEPEGDEYIEIPGPVDTYRTSVEVGRVIVEVAHRARSGHLGPTAH